MECEDGYHLDTLFYCVADNEPVKVKKDPLVQYFEDRLDDYEDDPPKTWSELDEKWKLEHLVKCWYGLSQSRGIQTENSFVTSSWIEDSTVAKATDASVIDRAMDICRAESTFLELVGDKREAGDVRSRQGWFGIIEESHTERASDVPTWSQERVNQEANQGIDTTKNYCEEVQHLGLQTKEYLGCNPPKVHVITNGFVNYANEIEDKWTQYKLDGGLEQAKQIRAEKLSDHNKALMQSARAQDNFEEQYVPSTTDKIRAIENSGWSLYPKDDRPTECMDGTFSKFTQGIEYLEYLKRCGE
jgi:hypothetical protein